MYSAVDSSCHPIPGLAAGKNRVRIVQRPETHGIPGLPGGAANMRQQESIVELTDGLGQFAGGHDFWLRTHERILQ